ncbi:anti-sigma factor family protein [Sciscionella marina]|uniref:anti-sigma factor family protein n=1 Tax=Sciscionella marina TaxID=508770 RepID=UPI000365E98E|nr:zf-HC2 domain-containing protein [Sciscionella marina]
MTIARGFGFGETHLMPDAIVAFVDEELSTTATERARAHLAKCPYCAQEADAQRAARDRMRSLDTPGAPANLLAALRAIPEDTEVTSVPDGLAVTEDGQLVSVQRPDRAFGAGAPLGSTPPLGTTAGIGAARAPLGGRRGRKRAAQGAGALVSGLMLGALAFGIPGGSAQTPTPAKEPAAQLNNNAPRAAFGARHTKPKPTPTERAPQPHAHPVHR